VKISLFEKTDRVDRPFMAIALVLIGVFVLAAQDTFIKLMSVETSFWQFQTLRSLSNLCLLFLLALISGGLSLLVPINKKVVYIRALFLTVCMFFFFGGAPYLSVAQMAAGLYTYPVFVSLLAGPVLGEAVGRWRIGSIVLGIAGASLMLSPWEESFSLIQIMPIIAGFFYGCNILIVRRFCRAESTLALAWAVGVVFISCGIIGVVSLTIWPLSSELQQSMPFVAIGWPPFLWSIVGFAILMSILNLTGNICITRAYQTADASLLAPLDFTYLLFAALWGRLMFEQWPDGKSWLGMSLILIAGLITAWRESRTN
jgi:drug/metabolite transporter (DMT)-like permease